MAASTPLHPDAAALVARLTRPGATPFHALPTAAQRIAQDKMLTAFAPEPPAVAEVRDAWMERDAADGGALRFRLYRPQGSRSQDALPALLWFYGGGCTVGSIEGYDVLCRHLASQTGCVVIALAYRLAPEHPFPAAVDDAFFAVRWLAWHARSLAIDAARLAVGGDSAGGNLATVTALRCRDERGPALRMQLLVYPDTDKRAITAAHRDYAEGYILNQGLLRCFRDNYLPDSRDYLDWRASPILAESLQGLPPALVLTASHDPLRDDGHAYAERLRSAGVATEYVEYAGMVHNFFTLGRVIPTANLAVSHAALALRRAMFDANSQP